MFRLVILCFFVFHWVSQLSQLESFSFEWSVIYLLGGILGYNVMCFEKILSDLKEKDIKKV